MGRDTITIKDLELSTHIGVPEQEREEEQKLLVSIALKTDAKAAGEADDVSKTIDYQNVVDDVKKLAEKERKTLEHFAEDIATHILRTYNASSVSVEIKKFIIPETDHVAVSITRP